MITSIDKETAEARESFLQAKDRLIHTLDTTPDERINWSPSPTSRTPLQLFAHATVAIHNITETLKGRPYTSPTTGEADKGFREWEKQFTSRNQVVGLLEKNSEEYLDWLDKVTPEQLDATLQMPFGFGTMQCRAMLPFQPFHINEHVAQMTYVQTAYGDLDWHLG